jgi:hypothetical protein
MILLTEGKNISKRFETNFLLYMSIELFTPVNLLGTKD